MGRGRGFTLKNYSFPVASIAGTGEDKQLQF